MPYVYGGVSAILEFPENQHRHLSRFESLAKAFKTFQGLIAQLLENSQLALMDERRG